MKEIKMSVYAALLVGAFVATILLSIVGVILENSGFRPSQSERIAIMVFAFILFLIMAFSVVPVMVKSFFYLFDKMRPVSVYGPLPSWLIAIKEKHMIIVYVTWAMYIFGLLIALPFMIKDGFFNP